MASVVEVSTSSFVTEVLATAGGLEKEDLNVKLGKLSGRIEEVKVEVYESLQKQYADFYPSLDAAIGLSNRVKTLQDDMDAVSSRISNEMQSKLNVSTAELRDLSSQLNECNSMVFILQQLGQVYDTLQHIGQSQNDANFTQAAVNVASVRTLLEGPLAQYKEQLHIVRIIEEAYSVQQQKLVHSVAESWSKHVTWDLPNSEQGDSDKSGMVQLTIASSENAKTVLKNTAQAMCDLCILDEKLTLLSSRFLKYVAKPIVTKDNVDAKVESEKEKMIMKIVRVTEKDETKSKAKSYEKKLKKIAVVMKFLHERLLGIQVRQTGKESQSLMSMFGAMIGKQFLQLVIEECLADLIPSNSKELGDYNVIKSYTQSFQRNLIEIKFIGADNTSLQDYVNNVNVLFANKRSKEILEKARILMTSELHNTTEVGPEQAFGDLAPLKSAAEKKSEKTSVFDHLPLTFNAHLNASTFRMPVCQISVSIQKLMLLLYETLHEATTSSPACGIQLFYTTRNVMELFCSVVPTYHQQILSTLPQAAALHHNNCMYLAHHLMTLGHQFQSRLPEVLGHGAGTFVDLVPKLRRLGTECFLTQMTTQKTQLLECLQGAQGFLNVSEEDNFTKAQRAVKQVLHQLNSVSKVWQGTLPGEVYNKSIGTLLNSVLVEIIDNVTKLEDISEDDGSQLIQLMTLIVDEAPSLLHQQTEDGEEPDDKVAKGMLYSHVAKWSKFHELRWLLDARLQDIADRWAEGKGPLAAEMSPNQVKQLIRALFQNTDRRANILLKIK